MIPVAISCCYAFMLPVGTPCNAQAISTGKKKLRPSDMVIFISCPTCSINRKLNFTHVYRSKLERWWTFSRFWSFVPLWRPLEWLSLTYRHIRIGPTLRRILSDNCTPFAFFRMDSTLRHSCWAINLTWQVDKWFPITTNSYHRQ